LFSPRAAGMAHHVGTEVVSRQWARMCNDIIHKVCTLLPRALCGGGATAPVSQCVARRDACIEDSNAWCMNWALWALTSTPILRVGIESAAHDRPPLVPLARKTGWS
jgi:hypothetical protein